MVSEKLGFGPGKSPKKCFFLKKRKRRESVKKTESAGR